VTAPVAELGTVQRIVAQARQLEAAGRDIVRLDIGEPDVPTPPHIIEAGVRALRDGATKYVAPAGLPALRKAIAASMHARDVEAGAEHVVVTAGARAMLWYALLSLVRPGDDVLVPDPGYPGYATAIRLAGGEAVPYAITCDAGRFALDADALRAAVTPRTRVLIVNAPQNPTGAAFDDDALEAIAAVVREHDLWVISDEIYSSLAFGALPQSVASLPGMATRTVVVDGFSKTCAMTGWRLGYGVMPDAIARAVASLVSECATCTPAFVQHAGIAALVGPQDAVRDMRAAYATRTNAFARGVSEIPGVVAAAPAGAFYVFADLSGAMALGTTDTELAERLLHGYGVACVPGSAYGTRGEGFMRFACTTPEARLYEAIGRIAAALTSR
jgi:aspartate aminotransferase